VRVLKAGDVRAVQAVQVDAAAARAAELAAEADRQEALAAAYAAGFDDGVKRAIDLGAEAAPRGAAALETLLAEVTRLHAEEVAATSRAVLSAALDVARWVLRGEVQDSTRSLLARLDESAGALLPSPTTRVLVSAADEEAVTAWAAGRSAVTVVVDPALPPGDASVETDAGNLDVSVAAALRIAAEALDVEDAR
jgi:flagellar biosynthesis/type III secretory pathway protein FliH